MTQLPDDPSELARIAADPVAPCREQALDALRPHLERAARGVLRRHAVSDDSIADDLVQEVLLLVSQGRYDYNVGPFLPWARTIMRNRVIDLLRRRLPAQLPDQFDSSEPTSIQADTERVADFTRPFSDADMTRICGWKVYRRIILLSQGGWLYRKVPSGEWNGWLTGCGAMPPFPPDDFGDLPLAERNLLTAQALGISVGQVSQHWHRGQEQLRSLDFVQEMLP